MTDSEALAEFDFFLFLNLYKLNDQIKQMYAPKCCTTKFYKLNRVFPSMITEQEILCVVKVIM